MEESKTITRLKSVNRPKKDYQAVETEKDEVAMMFWENSEGSLVEDPNKKTDDQGGRAEDKIQKPKDEEEHVNSILHTGNH